MNQHHRNSDTISLGTLSHYNSYIIHYTTMCLSMFLRLINYSTINHEIIELLDINYYYFSVLYSALLNIVKDHVKNHFTNGFLEFFKPIHIIIIMLKHNKL